MKISELDYNYPEELIAQHPLAKRSASKMMVVERNLKKVQHASSAELDNFLRADDLLIINNTKVAPARIFGSRRNGEPIELLVVEPAGPANLWRCLLKKAKRIHKNEQFFFGMQATAIAKGREGVFLLVEFKGRALKNAMQYHGAPPLPPYINRQGLAAYSQEDRERYQTVFAKKSGSAAAPTAGLHFDEETFAKLKAKGVEIQELTLHVGIDTFTPMRVDDSDEHKMHGEQIEISAQTAESISNAKKAGRRVIALGTTATRALESAYFEDQIKSGSWTTHLFVTPGYQFKVVDGMITNFHQPRSTLIMLVAAFMGKDFLLECYQTAIEHKYRLFSYGDCMLIL